MCEEEKNRVRLKALICKESAKMMKNKFDIIVYLFFLFFSSLFRRNLREKEIF